VAEHILHDRSTINEPELSVSINLVDDEQLEFRGVDCSCSIFEEPITSNCSASIEGIAEVDPMGASLLLLLSRPRPFNNSIRASTLITQIED
jgi:hypothetical protein